ncbi:MAG TPA: hypothetical protein VG986_22665 [Pseudolabrys sp.]|nr:hypothetical protein [Pseudolabrys sp.]
MQRRSDIIGGIVLLAALQLACITHAAAGDGGRDGQTVIIQTEHGPVKGKIVQPESSKEKPGDVGKRVHTPLEVIIPDKPIEPPVPRSDKGN